MPKVYNCWWFLIMTQPDNTSHAIIPNYYFLSLKHISKSSKKYSKWPDISLNIQVATLNSNNIALLSPSGKEENECSFMIVFYDDVVAQSDMSEWLQLQWGVWWGILCHELATPPNDIQQQLAKVDKLCFTSFIAVWGVGRFPILMVLKKNGWTENEQPRAA